MTTKSNKNQKKAKQGQPNTAVCDCTDCLWANLVQYDAPCDPLLAECTKKPQPNSDRFPYAIEIARAKKVCPMHKHTDEKKEIQVRVKVRHISQACYVKSQLQLTA